MNSHSPLGKPDAESVEHGGSVDNSTISDEEVFETLDQNGFLMECFMTNSNSDVGFILLFFFNDECTISDTIEKEVSKLILSQITSRCQCRRINSRQAPLFTAKLGVDPEHSATLVAMRNGDVIDKLSTCTPDACSEVESWLLETGILGSRGDDNGDSFSSLSIDF